MRLNSKLKQYLTEIIEFDKSVTKLTIQTCENTQSSIRKLIRVKNNKHLVSPVALYIDKVTLYNYIYI